MQSKCSIAVVGIYFNIKGQIKLMTEETDLREWFLGLILQVLVRDWGSDKVRKRRYISKGWEKI